MTSRFRGRGRQMLHTARVRRQTDASPTRQLPSLPPLISMAEIRQLREQVRPVSLPTTFHSYVLLIFLSRSACSSLSSLLFRRQELHLG